MRNGPLRERRVRLILRPWTVEGVTGLQ
jgi:hypothetical protein